MGGLKSAFDWSIARAAGRSALADIRQQRQGAVAVIPPRVPSGGSCQRQGTGVQEVHLPGGQATSTFRQNTSVWECVSVSVKAKSRVLFISPPLPPP